jgi:hypothetical protein
MTEDQGEKILRELRAIKMAIWTAILIAALGFVSQKLIDAVFGPLPPPPVTIQPPK